jgi:outer membrane translocation and assembly module TamA
MPHHDHARARRQLRSADPAGAVPHAPERIVEIAGLPEGVTYSPAVLDRVTERLRDTGVFSAVALGEQPLGPGDTMDIVATLTESPPRRFGFGAELSTDEGARVSAFWLHRNLFGGAERLRIEGEIRGIGEGELSTTGWTASTPRSRAHLATGHLHARHARLWRDRDRRP